jgi:hypothetical protein
VIAGVRCGLLRCAGGQFRVEEIGRLLGSFGGICGWLVFEAVAEFGVDFAWVVIVEAAEGEAVVEQDSAIGDVGCGDGCGEFVGEGLSDGEIEGGVLG